VISSITLTEEDDAYALRLYEENVLNVEMKGDFMRKTRLLALVLAFALSASLSTGAIAADSSYEQEQPEKYQLEAGLVVNMNDSTVSLNNAETWAYEDYSKGTDFEKVNILKARSIMMQHTDWVADGFIGIYTAPDGTQEVLPTFSEVFPDWDYEQICAYNCAYNNQVDALTEQETVSLFAVKNEYFDCDIPVVTSGNAPNVHFSEMYVGNTNYMTTNRWMYTCTTCNIGYSIDEDGVGTYDVGYRENIPAGGGFGIYTPSTSGYCYMDVLKVRVSTYDVAGSGTFNFLVT
jgi:hypothetical protein